MDLANRDRPPFRRHYAAKQQAMDVSIGAVNAGEVNVTSVTRQGQKEGPAVYQVVLRGGLVLGGNPVQEAVVTITTVHPPGLTVDDLFALELKKKG